MNKEWLAISLVVGMLILLVVSASYSHIRAEESLADLPPPRELQIDVVGAVERPGVYTCPPGAQLQEVLKKAGVKQTANRRKIPFKKILLSDQTVEVIEEKRRNLQREKISLVEKPELCYDLTS